MSCSERDTVNIVVHARRSSAFPPLPQRHCTSRWHRLCGLRRAAGSWDGSSFDAQRGSLRRAQSLCSIVRVEAVLLSVRRRVCVRAEPAAVDILCVLVAAPLSMYARLLCCGSCVGGRLPQSNADD